MEIIIPVLLVLACCFGLYWFGIRQNKTQDTYEMKDVPFDKKFKPIILIVLVPWIIYGCVSASSQTGAQSEAQLKSQQQQQTDAQQKTTSNDTTSLEIASTHIEITDTATGKVILSIDVGGGKAKTGSQSMQNSTTNLTNEQVTEAITKSSSDAASKSSASIMPFVWILVIGVVILLVVKGIEKGIPALSKVITITKKLIS